MHVIYAYRSTDRDGDGGHRVRAPCARERGALRVIT